MTQTPDDRAEEALEALLAQARSTPPVPDPALLARIAAEGAAAQAEAAGKARARSRAASRPTRHWSLAGFWPGAAALAGCLVLGVGIGARFEADLTSVGALYLGQGAQTETVLWSYDLALEEGV